MEEETQAEMWKRLYREVDEHFGKLPRPWGMNIRACQTCSVRVAGNNLIPHAHLHERLGSDLSRSSMEKEYELQRLG